MTQHEIRCPKCSKLLYKAEGTGTVIEIKCDRCNSMVQWPSLKPIIVQLKVRNNGQPVGPSVIPEEGGEGGDPGKTGEGGEPPKVIPPVGPTVVPELGKDGTPPADGTGTPADKPAGNRDKNKDKAHEEAVPSPS